ncbi:hypothetical protein CM19_05470 [Candidatus Acidianus copahuensis]|uniref:Uncharacterized protein n=1 Tax=Candidatus Acidianus copahuensis TaxID=1160895 RepID=A0A031LP12_9CREN|nr:hypothetical protein [Candidatus Acidianus copahuensis]EZQ06822.1 hypothetical protein CM19_05470 [Candidatus Acidianus copahuensis]
MPRKKKEDIKAEEIAKGEHKSSKKKKEKYVDPDQLLEEYLKDVVEGLGIEFLGLTDDEYIEILREPFASAVGQVKTKPKVKTILNRLLSNRDSMMEYVAVRLYFLRDIEKLGDTQLEFLVYNIKKGINQMIDKLYSECKRRNRNDLIEILRYSWNQFGILTPLRCPKCGFNAIMPDLSCKVCGYIISMKEVKEQIDVLGELKTLASIESADFKEIITSGYFFYTPQGILPPSKFVPSQGGIFYEIVLNKDEKKILSSIYIDPQKR